MMMFRVLAILLGAIALQGCATHTGKQCEDNFTTSGSFLTGKSFTTTSELPTTTPSVAFTNAYKMLLRESFHVESADPKRGVISAYQNVNLSSKTAPLNVIVEPVGEGSKITFVFAAAAGLYTPESGARDKFCEMIGQVTQ
ncbi:hypothetical protein [Pseudomonas sp. MHK4]|jgi:hypothetical protein